MKPGAVVVIPCYNERDRLQIGAFKSFVRGKGGAFRFIFVDDGSRDGTAVFLESLAAEGSEVFKVICLPENRGKAEAVRRGILSAVASGAECVGFLDADLSAPLDALLDLRGVLEGRPDLAAAIGSRVKLLGNRIARRTLRHYLGRIFATIVDVMLSAGVYDSQCGAKLFRVSEDVRIAFRDPFVTRWLFDVEILARLLKRRPGSVAELPLREWREVGGSKLRLKDVAGTLWGLYKIHRAYFRRGTN